MMINIAQPAFLGVETDMVSECLSGIPNLSMGGYTRDFEEIFADWIGVKHAVACSSGTTALQLAFKVIADQGPKCPRVFIPNLTYIATANAVSRTQGIGVADIVLVDPTYTTWNMDVELLRGEVEEGDVIIPVHLYGNPCAMDEIMDIADEACARVIEDACQAHGATYRGERVGSIGDAGVFSFFGNKILTCGEGGMITTNDGYIAEKCRYYRGQAVGPGRYEHNDVGFNYRLTDMQAAIGTAQTMLAENHLELRQDIRDMYRQKLRYADLDFQMETTGAKSVAWLETVRLPRKYDTVCVGMLMEKDGVETRPTFPPTSTQLPYRGECVLSDSLADNNALKLSKQLLSLPTHASLNEADVDTVCASLVKAMGKSTCK
jgi:perosamine synthetase